MRRVSKTFLLSAFFGNLFEHYDTALFGFLSPFLAPLIFPKHDPLSALILTYAMIPLGMLARPLGALVFGYIGDVYGRKRALFLSLAGMGAISALIAICPTYVQAGLLAPILFSMGRLLQNFLSAGESMGGSVFLLENTHEKWRDLLSSLFDSSTMGGHLLASLGVVLLAKCDSLASGWRGLYLIGALVAFFGLTFRSSSPPLATTPSSQHSLASLKGIFWAYRKPFLCIVVASGFAHAVYSIALVLMNGLIPLISPVTQTEVMQINTYLLIFDLCALPLFGWIASKVAREKVMLAASIAALLLAIPLMTSLKGASYFHVVWVRALFVTMGVAFFAPFRAWAHTLIPPSARYLAISMGYALGSQLLGGPTAALALWTFKKTGALASVAWYWMALALLTTGALLWTIRAKIHVIEEVE